MGTQSDMNMGRSRGGRFRGRPRNVEIDAKGEVIYFKYVFPDGNRKSIGSSRDTASAFAKAEALNSYFAQQQVSIESLIQRPQMIATPHNPMLSVLIAEFRKHDPKRKNLAKRTREEQDYKLNLYERTWPDRTIQSFETIDLSRFLNDLSDNAYVKHRALLHSLFQFAGHQGYIPVNPVNVTLVKGESAKVRQRHTMEGYRAILDAAPDWLQRAMRVGLYSLQRREDVVLLHKVTNAVDLDAGTLTILQRKTLNYTNPVYIKIEMGSELYSAVEDCVRSSIPCPYLIHVRPRRMTAKARQAKPHPFAVMPDYLSREFRAVRDRTRAYADMTPEERPTFHELRSLGSHLYEQAGYSLDYIMALSGHANEKTLQRYLKDHIEKAPKRVCAGLTAGQLPS